MRKYVYFYGEVVTVEFPFNGLCDVPLGGVLDGDGSRGWKVRGRGGCVGCGD